MIYDLTVPVDEPELDPIPPIDVEVRLFSSAPLVPITVDLAGVGIPVDGGGGVSLGETSTTAYRGDRGKIAYDHVSDGTDAHAASAITNTPAGGIAATTVQAALNELDTDKAAASHNHAASAITSGMVDTARLGSGTANSGTYLRGDQTWAAVSSSPWVTIADTTLSVDTAQQQWTGLSGYRLIRLFAWVKTTRAGTTTASLLIQCNADTGANYSTGSSTGQTSVTVAAALPGAGYTAAGVLTLDFYNMGAGVEKHVIGIVRGVNSAAAAIVGGSWNNTAAAITSIELASSNTAELASGSRFLLLGVV